MKVITDVREEKIGGEGAFVEIDETLVHKRKYNRGRLLFNESKQRWVVGGIQRGTNKVFAEYVEDRKADTLCDIILRNVLPGSVIATDQWKAYQRIEDHGFILYQVNHSQNFVDPNNPLIHTQNIERNWLTLKETIPKHTHGEPRETYLVEHLYRRKYFGKNPSENFKTILNDIAVCYPGAFGLSNNVIL